MRLYWKFSDISFDDKRFWLKEIEGLDSTEEVFRFEMLFYLGITTAKVDQMLIVIFLMLLQLFNDKLDWFDRSCLNLFLESIMVLLTNRQKVNVGGKGSFYNFEVLFIPLEVFLHLLTWLCIKHLIQHPEFRSLESQLILLFHYLIC